MYAVFVIAAILLSVSPMHARTLLAALPASTPGHQFAPDDSDQDQTPRAGKPHLPPASRATAHAALPASALHAPRLIAPTPVSQVFPAIAISASGQLEHSPHAP